MRFPLSLRRLVSAVLLGSAAALAPLSPAAQLPEGWFPWPTVEPKAGSALDVSALNPKPAGAHGPVTVREGRFVTADGARVRFWGCNLGAADVFVSPAHADALARHLARGGVNIARLHHMDNPWGVATGHSLWSKDRADRTRVDPKQLDQVHRLIAALKREGIYTNLNLKVSKFLGPADGFPETVTQFPDFQKRVDIFNRRMIELQKDFARQLLAAKNPHTGLTLAADPALAVVEINNENSLLGYFTRDLGRGLDTYPEPFRRELVGLWNRWLAQRYGGDLALRAAWSAPAATGASAVSVLRPDTTWSLRNVAGGAGKLTPGSDRTAFSVEVTKTTGIDWHVQVVANELTVEEGAVYTLEFEAQADAPHAVGVGLANDSTRNPGEEWRSFGLLQSTDVGTAWQTVRFIFPVHSVSGSPAALAFNVSRRTGTVRIRNFRLTAGSPGSGVPEGQTLVAGTVDLPREPTTGMWRDWIQFLADTERAFAEEMRAFLQDELGVKAPIACSQIDFGGITALHREQSMDFADAHGYWQHPDFPSGEGWNPQRWSIRNTPQVTAFHDRSFGQLGANVLTRVAGKPFSVSEYDHPAPSDFVCEMYPEFAVIGSRQDWDALYPFALDAYGRRNPTGKLNGFFDQMYHPAKWSFAPFATVLFRREYVAPAAASFELHPGLPPWKEAPHADVLWAKHLRPEPIPFLDARLAVSDRDGLEVAASRVDRSGAVQPGPARVIRAALGNVLVLGETRAAALVGYLGGSALDAGALHVECPRFGRDFAAVTAVSLDGLPLDTSKRVLITLAARAGNHDMVWNETRTSVGANWGTGPTIAERVPATVTLKTAPNAKRTIYALKPDGSRGKKITTAGRNGALRFTVDPTDNTMHYEVVTSR